MGSILILGAVLASSLVSCGPSESEKKAADKLCGCLEGVNMEDVSGLMSAASCMQDISSDEEMSSASQRGVMKVMEEKCPDEAKLFEELQSKGEEEAAK